MAKRTSHQKVNPYLGLGLTSVAPECLLERPPDAMGRAIRSSCCSQRRPPQEEGVAHA